MVEGMTITQADYTIRILITGSRDLELRHKELVNEKILDDIELFLHLCDSLPDKGFRPTVFIVEGGCKTGADLYARELVAALKDNPAVDVFSKTFEVSRSEWEAYGTAAGPIRNKRMVDAGASHCYAFLQEGRENKGTLGCAALAEKALIITDYVECPKGSV